MLKLERTSQFKKDYKRELKGRYKKVLNTTLIEILEKLVQEIPLDKKHYDHALVVNWKDCRDCHIRPDLILIYRKTETSIQLLRLGSHSELSLE